MPSDPLMQRPVPDDPNLLDAMLADARATSALWQPTAYWRGYCERIVHALRRDGLSGFQANQDVVKGFASGGVPEPAIPQKPAQQLAWTLLERAPGFRAIVAEYRRLLRAEHSHLVKARVLHAGLVMDRIAEVFPNLRLPHGIANGGAEDAFPWRGCAVTPDFVHRLARIADFYTRVPREDVRTILEIGPGLGHSTLAHIALNPTLQVAINVDIVPILYVSTQYLKSVAEIEVVDYTQAGRNAITVTPGARPRIYQLAPWQLPRVAGEADYFFNAFSFQEMERDICRNYAQAVGRITRRGALLHSTPAGHKQRAGGQQQPVTLDFLADLFTERFPAHERIDGLWPALYGSSPDHTRLLRSADA